MTSAHLLSATAADAVTLRAVLSRTEHPALGWADRGGQFTGGLHLAVMTGPFLDLIVARIKTVESRFHRQRRAPLFAVQPSDVVVFRQAGQPARLAAIVTQATYLPLDELGIDAIRAQWSGRIGTDDDAFWNARADARWVTLLALGDLISLPATRLRKRDRQGWVSYPAPAYVSGQA